MAWACMAASGSSMLINDVTMDKRSRTNPEVYGTISSAQIQPKLIGQCFTVQMDNDLKYTTKAAQEFFKAKKWNILQST